ncbi:MAG: DUF1330 domain-containing protein [Phenylobacterium sp.]|jgi:uncharacterized protein (DUF1330 family)
MAAYLLAEIEITDPVGFDAYRRDVGEVITRFGGRYLARGGAAEVLEGDRALRRTVLLEFPDMAQLKAFYASPQYEPLLKLRMSSANTDALIFEGV